MYNFIMLAQNNKETDYVTQAAVCAMSIKRYMPTAQVAVITNDDVPLLFQQFFDHIVPIPWNDSAAYEEWKVHNRWKIIHASPFDEAVILDTDMIVVSDISEQCEYMKNYEIFYTNSILDYRGNTVTSDFYRKNFTKYNLPNLYCAFSYFKKTEFSFKFYEMLGTIAENWEECYKIDGTPIQKHLSMDTTVSLAARMLACEQQITASAKQMHKPTFVHMKPNIQGWNRLSEKWTDKIGAYVNQNLELYVGNHRQQGLFHYTEDEFVKTELIRKYCNYHGVDYEIQD